ncbi:MAG: hypothetical protein K2M97_02475, partial [Muribaculaceae bacterium]|nr:hypothetical protein [Muribaculaceae bacterium]
STSLHADYLASITTSMYGYNPDRVFDLQLVIGVFGGGANYIGPVKPTLGLKGGFQAAFRLNKALDLVVEPQFLASYGPTSRHDSHWTPDIRALLGLRYRLGTPLDGRGYIEDTPYGDRRNFAGISAGPSLFSGSSSRDNVNVSGDVAAHVGRWFSMVSGLRLTYANDWVRYERRTRYVGSLHLNYLLNFTSLLDRDASRRFHIIGAIGGGVGFCPGSESSVGPMAYAGVQFRYNLPANLDIHIEPGFNFWYKTVLPNPNDNTANLQRFTMTGALNVGLSYRF